MPFSIEFTDAEIIRDPTSALFRASVMISAQRRKIEGEIKGRPMSFSKDFRGVVTSVTPQHITIKNDAGVEKLLPLTEARARQLTGGDTTRK